MCRRTRVSVVRIERTPGARVVRFWVSGPSDGMAFLRALRFFGGVPICAGWRIGVFQRCGPMFFIRNRGSATLVVIFPANFRALIAVCRLAISPVVAMVAAIGQAATGRIRRLSSMCISRRIPVFRRRHLQKGQTHIKSFPVEAGGKNR